MTTGYHPYYQYAYCHSPLYVSIERAILDLAGWSSYDIQDGCIDAPEALPVGSAHGPDKTGSCVYKDFVWREYTKEEADRINAIADAIIDEILQEERDENYQGK